MSDDNSINDDDVQPENPNIRQLREKAKQADVEARGRADAEAKLAEAERKIAFMGAGIDLADPKNAYFVKGYDGENTPEAIRAEAEAAGFLAPPPPAVPLVEQQAWDRTANLSAGAPPASPAMNHDQALMAAQADGTIRSAEDVAAFLRGRDPSLVAGDV